MRLEIKDILDIVSNELQTADNSEVNTTAYLEKSLELYLGSPDGTEVEGRSQVVSTDIADAIEWIMPQIMKSFTQNNEVVVFDPVHKGDEYQAELESQYVYEVLMKQNDGFIILHQFIKDALMQRNGLLKVYYANHITRKICDYTGITTEQFQYLVNAEGIEILEHSQYVDPEGTLRKQQAIQGQLQSLLGSGNVQPQMLQQLQQQLAEPVVLHDVKISVERRKGKIYVDPVPMEEFRVSARHNSINLRGARFTAHVTTKTLSDIQKEYDISFKEAKDLPRNTSLDLSDYRFILQDGSIFQKEDGTIDDSQTEVTVAECFVEMDVDQVGIAKLMKVTVAGSDDTTPTDLLALEEVDDLPWVSTTAILMSHKFMGMSITDRLVQIQKQKTSLWRNLLDNIYLQNNQRTLVVENSVNIDDLLVSRPGGIIRAKRADAVVPLATPQLSSEAFNMMGYLDQVRAGRTGVDAEGPATPANVGDRVGSQGVNRLMNSKEELVGLIIRVIAETGIKPLCVKIRDLCMKHMDSVVDFRFRDEWYKLQPSAWYDRTSCTVRVGTGTGNNTDRITAIRGVIELQAQMAANPITAAMLSPQKAFMAIDDLCKFTGLMGANRYFVDPTSQEGQQAIQSSQQASQKASEEQKQLEAAMAQAQMKIADAEQQKAAAQSESVRAKAQIDSMKNTITAIQNQHKSQIEAMKAEFEQVKLRLEQRMSEAELQFKYDQLAQQGALELEKINGARNESRNN